MSKKTVLRGITAASTLLLGLAIFGRQVAFDNEGQVNNFLNGGATSGESAKSSYKNVKEMREAERKVEVQTEAEGSVLFFNKNAALPLKKNPRVTLFGHAAADPIFKGTSGGSDVKKGMESVADFKSAFTSRGIAINETMYNALAASEISRNVKGDIAEEEVSFYTSELQASYASDYNDAAIVVLSRLGGEQNDLSAHPNVTGDDGTFGVVTDEDGYPVDVEGKRMLSLHDRELALLDMIKNSGKFAKIIVLLNTGNPMEIGQLEEHGVDSCLWIGYPGFAGLEGVADMLVGNSAPTGRLVDTYATSSYSSPAMSGFGDFTWANITTRGQNKYIVYAEGIYIGYKYYETRYYDQILNKHNATSSKGTFASSAGWNYADEMDYTFGYGTSYANFKEEVVSLSWDQSKHEVNAEVKVTHLGNQTGSLYEGATKHTVELYVNTPYIDGGVEKSAISLIGYGKTKELKEGESDTVKISASDYLFASYDQNATNGADNTKKGCYILDQGDYVFAVGSDAHDALNNVLALNGVGGLFDAKGNSVTGNPSLAKKVNLAAYDNVTYAKSENGELVYNRFDGLLDLNDYVDDSITYLTRNDWNTFPVHKELDGLLAPDAVKTIIDGQWYKIPADAPSVSSFKHDQVYDDPIHFIDMKGVAFDDEKWERFIDQLSISQMASIVGEVFGNPAFDDPINCEKNVSYDGPDGIQTKTGYEHVCAVLACSTFNDELLKLRGEFMAEDGMACGQQGVYGFGCNMHRTPYGGRNFEYYSEDANMSYLAGGVQTKAATDKGLITYVKHFLANDQEIWRSGNSTIMTEQCLREYDARGFEGAFVKGGSLGTMTSNTRVGFEVNSMSKSLMTGVLRTEWGFKGLAMTDSSAGSHYFLRTIESVEAGTDQFNNDKSQADTIRQQIVKSKDGNMYKNLREIAKRYFYVYTHSFNTANQTSDQKVEVKEYGWKIAMNAIVISIAAVTGILALSTLGLSVYSTVKGGKKDD